MTERAAARVHYNLLDSHVAICTPQLLVVFADNFDYQEMAHLIKGVMERDEVAPAPHAHAARLTFLCPPPLFLPHAAFFLFSPDRTTQLTSQKVYASIYNSHYAARVGDFNTYDAVTYALRSVASFIPAPLLPLAPGLADPLNNSFPSRDFRKDVLHRWAYPLTPDIFGPSGHMAKFKTNHVYLQDNVILARCARIFPLSADWRPFSKRNSHPPFPLPPAGPASFASRRSSAATQPWALTAAPRRSWPTLSLDRAARLVGGAGGSRAVPRPCHAASPLTARTSSLPGAGVSLDSVYMLPGAEIGNGCQLRKVRRPTDRQPAPCVSALARPC